MIGLDSGPEGAALRLGSGPLQEKEFPSQEEDLPSRIKGCFYIFTHSFVRHLFILLEVRDL